MHTVLYSPRSAKITKGDWTLAWRIQYIVVSLNDKSVLPLLPISFQFEIRQLRAHLAQQDLDLVAEREAAMQIHHMWGKQSSSFHEVDGLATGASEHHGQAKTREPGGPAGNRLEHLPPLYN